MAQVALDHPLRTWHKTAGLTLEAAAAKVGTSRQVWSDWERGRRKPDASFMPKVRSVTGGKVSADDFYPPISDAA